MRPHPHDPESPPSILVLEIGHVRLTTGDVFPVDGPPSRLSGKELGLLRALAARPRETVDRSDLLTAVWGLPAHSLSRAVDDTMRRLRARIERTPGKPQHLITVHG